MKKCPNSSSGRRANFFPSSTNPSMPSRSSFHSSISCSAWTETRKTRRLQKGFVFSVYQGEEMFAAWVVTSVRGMAGCRGRNRAVRSAFIWSFCSASFFTWDRRYGNALLQHWLHDFMCYTGNKIATLALFFLKQTGTYN